MYRESYTYGYFHMYTKILLIHVLMYMYVYFTRTVLFSNTFSQNPLKLLSEINASHGLYSVYMYMECYMYTPIYMYIVRVNYDVHVHCTC